MLVASEKNVINVKKKVSKNFVPSQLTRAYEELTK